MQRETPLVFFRPVIGPRTIGLGCIALGTLLTALLGIGIGCHDDTPPPPRVPVPASVSRDPTAMRERDEVRPLPPPSARPVAARPPFNDVPLVDQEPPEQAAFVDAYRRVGSPKITLFVNRTMEGDIIPVNPDEPISSIEHTRKSKGAVDVETHDSSSTDEHGSAHAYGGWYDSHGDYHAYTRTDSSDKFNSKGPAEYHESTAVYLHPGQYDEVAAKSLDYEAIENIMTDWIASNGAVTVISPTIARQRLTDEQVKDLQSGRPQMLSEIAQQLGADVLIQVQAHPTRQTEAGLEVRLVVEAMNTKGGQSLARAVVDMQPPLVKTAINRYTRFLARKIMQDMTGTWSAPPPPEMRRTEAPTPAPAPPEPAPPAPPAAQPQAGHVSMPPMFAPETTAPTTAPSGLP